MQNKSFRVSQFQSSFSLYRDVSKSEQSMKPLVSAESLEDLKVEARKVLSGSDLNDAIVAISRFQPVK